MRYAAAVTMTALFAGCRGEPSSAPPEQTPAQAVRVATASDVAREVGDEVVGTVRARSVAAVSASVMGTVRAVRVNLGTHVRAGDVLVQLTAGEIDAKAAQAHAMLAQAKVVLERAKQLKASHSIPDAEYDAAAAQFQVAEAAHSEAEVMRGYTVIRAPIEGVVTAKQCDVGDLALPGRALLVLENPGALRLEAAVPEAVAGALVVGAAMPVHVDALGSDLDATVSELAPSADPVSRTVLVKLDLPPTAELRPGMFGRLVVRTGEMTALTVPTSAIVHRGQLETVFVIDQGKATLRLIHSGRRTGERTEILAGLEPGETVAATDASQLVDGQPVRAEQ